jgi:O-antigen/teichoic acid export membrane protein
MPAERLLDLLRRRGAVDSQWMLSSGLFRAAIAFGSNLVLVRFLLPEEFGTFALRLATASLVLSVVSLRTGTQVIRLNEAEVAEGGLSLYWNVLIQETAVAGLLAWAWLSALGEGTGLTAALPVGLLQGAFMRVTVLLAGVAGSPAAVGFFYQAHRLAVVPQQLLDPLTGRVALNWFSRAESESERRRGGIRLLVVVLLPLLACLILVALLAEWAIPLVFGEAWRPVTPLLLGLSGVIVFYSLFGVARTYLLASRGTRYLVTGSALQFVGLLLPTLAWLLGKPRDVMDVAHGPSLAYAISFAFCAFFAWRKPADA